MLIDNCIKFHNSNDKERLFQRTSLESPSKVLAEWNNLLQTSTKEQDIHGFLELHPELLPGLYDLHNGPLHGIVVSKFPFGADYVSDFAFVTRHSMATQFTFVEIEDPAKPIFNNDGSFSQKFNQARQQIADWKLWASKNTQVLVDMFSPMFETYNAWNDYKDFRFYLVYGRRNEVMLDKKRKERWSSIWTNDENGISIMSYDRLQIEEDVKDRLIICNYQDRAFYAKSEVI